MNGKTLGYYQITNLIGKGGMGEVYQAKDQKLGRDVAIKVLPGEFAKDADRVARFQREAKVLASLNHPNIAAIYGLDESGGTNFLILELVEGETLADQIKQGPIPVEEALKLALQIAEALEAAHVRGVIHRDLKPANIKVTSDGKVKVLDFGLAKAYAAEQAESNLSASPTLSNLATQQGIILGTAAYMAPEQARGKNVDKRADIWAFGCLFYEMLTGQAAFQGEDVTEILAAVVKGGANLELLPANIQPRVREVIIRCLQKDLNRRYQDIRDARYEIEQVIADPNGLFVQPATTINPQTKVQSVLPWAAAFILTAIIAGVAVWYLKPTEPKQVVRFEYNLPEGRRINSFLSVAISPDGNQFVYGTPGGLYLRSVNELDARLVAGTEETPWSPFFSPDCKWVGYYSSTDKKLRKIPVAGGVPVDLCDASTSAMGATWNLDNTIIFGQLSKGIMRVSGNGGTPELLVQAKGGRMLILPQLLPDGKSVMFTDFASRPSKVIVQSLKSGEQRELFQGSGARYLLTGHIVYASGDAPFNLFAIPFDPDKLQTIGGPVPLIDGAGGDYAVSDSGTLVYVPTAGAARDRKLVWVDRHGKEEAIDAPSRAYVYAHLSPDGTRVALDIRDQENDIWIWDLARKTLSRLTFDPGFNRNCIWTPDGKKLAFSAERDGAENIYWQAADGSGTPEPLTKIPGASIVPKTFSPDGKQLLFSETVAPFDISLLSLNGSNESKRLLGTSFNENNPQISPDGRWLAYQSNESGSPQIYVRPFPDVDAKRWQISTGGGTRPVWNRNGRELFYYLAPGTMMAVPVETGEAFRAGSPTLLFNGEYLAPQTGLQYSVTPDGRRFLMIKDAATKEGNSTAPQRINVVVNWIEELKQRVPGR